MSTPSKTPKSSLPDTAALVNAFLDNCESRGLSKETIRTYKDFLFRFSKAYQQFPLTPEPIEQFVHSFQSSDHRRHGAYRTIRAFYNWVERRHSIENPINKTTAPRVRPTDRPALTMEELKKLLEYPYHSALTKALLNFLADTGCRISEAASLKADNILEDRVKVTGKTGERIIPVSPLVRQMLVDLGPKVFQYSARYLSCQVIRAGKLAGVKVTPHDLRRTFATLWRGSDISLKYIGGWRSWAMVEYYTKRKLYKAQDDHKIYSPVAILNPAAPEVSVDTPMPVYPQPIQPVDTDKIIQLATELGAAREKANNLEAERNSLLKQDDIQTIMRNYEFDLQVPFAKCLIHALLFRFCQNILETVESYAEKKIIPDCLLPSLKAYTDGDFDPREPAPDDNAYYAALIKEARQLYGIMGTLIRPFIVDNLSQSLIYKEICGDEIDIENVSLVKGVV